MGVVQAHGIAKDVFDKASDKPFVTDPDLEVKGGWVPGCIGGGLVRVGQPVVGLVEVGLEFFSIIFQLLDHKEMLESGFVEAGLDFLSVFDNAAFVVGPSDVSGFGLCHEVLDLVVVLVGFLFESLDVNGTMTWR